AEMDDGIELAALEPFRQFARRHNVGELAPGKITPLALVPEHVADCDIRAARVIQRGHNIRSDKTGAAGHQQHSIPCLDCAKTSFALAHDRSKCKRFGEGVAKPARAALPAGHKRLPTGRQSAKRPYLKN